MGLARHVAAAAAPLLRLKLLSFCASANIDLTQSEFVRAAGCLVQGCQLASAFPATLARLQPALHLAAGLRAPLMPN